MTRTVRESAVVPLWFAVSLAAIILDLSPRCAVAAERSDAPNPAAASRDYDSDGVIDANRIKMYATNFGSLARDLYSPGGPAGFFFPRETTKTAVFAAGLWMGARVDGETRVTVAEYDYEYGPGKILPGGGWGDVTDPRFRVYKIVRGDTSSPDYLGWPVADGAPVDAQGHPAFLGEQTLWAVYNDADPALHTANPGGTMPLGIEVQQTIFADYQAGARDHTVFMRFKILNQGGLTLDSAYVALWCDPDLGGPGDDLVGCDPAMNFGYCYNSTNSDAVYGAAPPAVGLCLLEGPIVPSPGEWATVGGLLVHGYRNLGMTAFMRYINGTDPYTALQSYNYIRGRNQDGSEMIDPTTGEPTRFYAPGDPLTGTGWCDANPSDRRMTIATGPFTMAPGDSQEVFFAFVVGQGSDRLQSITVLRQYVSGTTDPTPVFLSSLSAERLIDGVRIAWQVAEDAGGSSLALYRREAGRERERISEEWFSGSGLHEFIDREAPSGQLEYWLREAGSYGEEGWHGPVLVESSRREVGKPTLRLVGRNPVRSEATFRYATPWAGRVSLTIHDPAGRLVRSLIDQIMTPGADTSTWDGRDEAGRPVVPGAYFARLTVGGSAQSVKVIYLP